MKSVQVLLVVQLFVCSTWALANPTVVTITTSRHETTTSPERAPIFREALESYEDEFEITSEILHDDLSASAIEDLLDPSAELAELDMDHKQVVGQKKEKKKAVKLDIKKLPDDECERYELLAALNLAQAKMIAAIEPYRAGMPQAAMQKPAFRLGDSWRPQEPLGANINNYAPDNFDDLDVMRLFEMHRAVRELATGGGGGLPVSELRALNREVRESFKKAMLDFAPAVENEDTAPSTGELEVDDALDVGGAGDPEECAICRENLAAEPSARLPCGHVYHKGCLASWARVQAAPVNTCPRCREIFRLPYRMVKKLSDIKI